MKRYIILAALTLVFSACQHTAKFTLLESEFIYEKADFESCHAATIVETPEGDLLAGFFGGKYEGANDVNIWLCRKSNNSNKWTEPEMAATHPDFACWNPVLFQVPGDDLLLFYKTGPQVRMWTGHMKRSSDGGRTWSEPYDFDDPLFGAIKNKPIILSDGKIISGSSDERDGWKVHFEISDDGGRNWRMAAKVPAPDSALVIQPSIIEHKDGSLQALLRSRNGKLASTTSKDGGETWSRVEFFDFPQNNSGLDAVVLPDCSFAMICNPVGNRPGTDTGERTPLSLMLSKDGIHWDKALDLETEPGEYSYPSMILGTDGCLHIVYTWNRKLVRYAKVSI